ncbi:MAG: RidA family protein [Anaerolineae bacterium]|nr:RidA family protein [Gemmatimonadaceae bacterium]
MARGSDPGSHTILQPEEWARAVGYANGVAAQGRSVFVAGQIGWNPRTCEFESDSFVEQARQALQNVVSVVRTGGGEPGDVVCMTWFVTDKAAYVTSRREIGVAYREVFGRYFPAMSVVFVSALLEDRAQVEIEAIAVIGEHEGNAQRSLFAE